MSQQRPLPDSVVLLVEDDGFVRMCAAEMLVDAGFSVVEAKDADAAWAILLDRSDVGVLFTDIDMPGSMDGVTLAERVHAAWPGIRLILTSGRQRLADREVPDHGLFVPKPYSLSQVLGAIDHVA
ncbi:response regulator [Methylobacterium sp. J-077]|uniref:response regulator n=1 Tax=Methylobacterium sp. J-077 TaxID=2836656 RepID=UPI001FB94936|nr:response regulator [Methylobacterium sp. J-077]MCJ2124590.1 response regulator [Methylobacterium sp. J-077]